MGKGGSAVLLSPWLRRQSQSPWGLPASGRFFTVQIKPTANLEESEWDLGAF